MDKCEKCNYEDLLGKDLKIRGNIKLCLVCNKFAPADIKSIREYVSEKVDWHALEGFRKFARSKDDLKKGIMMAAAKKGNIVSRPAFGYKMENGELVPAENSDEVREIFEEFLDNQSLNAISRTHNMSVNGIKKILKNFTYIGKVKFDNQILKGRHQPIIDAELFNKVQTRFENLKKR